MFSLFRCILDVQINIVLQFSLEIDATYPLASFQNVLWGGILALQIRDLCQTELAEIYVQLRKVSQFKFLYLHP